MIDKLKDIEELQLIAFRLGVEEYALPITSVQEIIMPQTTTKMPKSPEFVEGVINLRGNIIPIIDGRKRFGLKVSEVTSESRIMVLELKDHTVGLIVDEVSEVVHLKTKDIDPAPSEFGKSNDLLMGIGKVNDRLLILLELESENFLDVKEVEGIKNVAKFAEQMSQTKVKAEV